MTTVAPTAPPSSGFSESFGRENRKWLKTGRWLKQAILWTVLLVILGFLFFRLLAPVSGLINLLNELYAFLQGDRNTMALLRTLQGQSGVAQVQFSSAILVLPILMTLFFTLISQAVIVIFSGQYFRELREGTLSWALARPITRGAYLLSKVLADGLGALVMVVLIPFGLLLLITLLTAREQSVTVGNYLVACGIIALGIVYWHSLVTMLTFLTRSRGLALGVPLVLLLAGGLIANALNTLVNSADFFTQIAPWTSRTLIATAVRGELNLSDAAMLVPLLATVVWIVINYALAYVSLKRMDL